MLQMSFDETHHISSFTDHFLHVTSLIDSEHFNMRHSDQHVKTFLNVIDSYRMCIFFFFLFTVFK